MSSTSGYADCQRSDVGLRPTQTEVPVRGTSTSRNLCRLVAAPAVAHFVVTGQIAATESDISLFGSSRR